MPMYFEMSDLVFKTLSSAALMGGVKTEVVSIAFRVRGAEDVSSTNLLDVGEMALTTINLDTLCEGGLSGIYAAIFESAGDVIDERTRVMTVFNKLEITPRFRSYELTRDVVTLATRHYASDTDLLVVNAGSELRSHLKRVGFVDIERNSTVAINTNAKPLISDYDARYRSTLGSFPAQS